jgi:hypothetical protein
MRTTVFRQQPGTGGGLRSAAQLLDISVELGTATVRVDLGEITEATAPVVTTAGLAVNALSGQVFAERLLGLDISLTKATST